MRKFLTKTKLYESLVLPIITYGAAIWGTVEFASINSVHNRACRLFLGVGKYTPNTAVRGDMGWKTPFHQQGLAITRLWCRLCNLNSGRFTKKIFVWAEQQALGNKKNWVFHVRRFFNSLQMNHMSNSRYTH